jgi:hypothetical protein
VWAKPLSAKNGSAAFLLNQNGQQSSNGTVFFADIGFLATTNATIRDLVARKELGNFVGSFTVELKPDESRLLKITPLPGNWP